MIPKEWRDYTLSFRPVTVCGWLLVSPAVALPLFYISSLDWSWLDAVKWDKDTASGWVQALGAILALIAAVAVPAITHQVERKQQKQDVLTAQLMVAMDMKEIYENLALWGHFVQLHPWKNKDYFVHRAQLILGRLSQLSGSLSGVGLWNAVSKSEASLCNLLAMLQRDGGVSAGVQEYAQRELTDWMNESFSRVDELLGKGRH